MVDWRTYDDGKCHLKVGDSVWWINGDEILRSKVIEIEDFDHRDDSSYMVYYWIDPIGVPDEDEAEYQKAMSEGSVWCPKYHPGHACSLGDEIHKTHKEALAYLESEEY